MTETNSTIFKQVIKHEDLVDYKSSCFENEKHQTQVSLLLELFSDAYLTANRTNCLWSSRQKTSLLDHTSQTTIRLKAAISSSRICSKRRTS